VPRDALAQRAYSERLGIAERPGERGMRRRQRGRGRRRCRLPHFHVDDVAARRLDTGGRRHDVHHHENRYFTAPGRDHLRNIRHQREPSESVKNTRPAVAAFGRFRAADVVGEAGTKARVPVWRD